MVNVPPKGGRKHPDQKFIEVNTEKILFIAGGAFDGIEKLISKRLNFNVIGYKSIKADTISDQNILHFINPKDLKEFGLIPEIIGRLPVVTYMDPLNKEALRRILTEPKNALIKQFVKLFEMDVVDEKSISNVSNNIRHPLDYLICNAGINNGYGTLFDEDHSHEKMLEVLNVNVLGCILTIRNFSKHLNTNAKIILISSIMGVQEHNGSNATIYRASKAAVNNVMVSISQEFKSKKIIVKGSLSREKDLIYCKDVANAILDVFKSNNTHGRTINLATGDKTTITEIINNIIVVIFDVNISPFSTTKLLLCSANKGIKAAEKVPSVKNLLNKLGNRKAIMKASAAGPAPKRTAKIISLINPSILLNNVQILTTALDLYMLACFLKKIIAQS